MKNSSHIWNRRMNRDKRKPEHVDNVISPVKKQIDEPSAFSGFAESLKDAGNDPEELGRAALSLIAREKEILQAIFLVSDMKKENPSLRFLAGYACVKPASEEELFHFGEGLPGQVAKNGKLMNLKEVPEGYITVRTGLGSASPRALLIIPVVCDTQVYGVIEMASFHQFTEEDERLFTGIGNIIGTEMKKVLKRKNLKS